MGRKEWEELVPVKYPIIQAPMAGGTTTTELVVAVSNYGGLGMIGAGYMTPEKTRAQIQDVKAKTSAPFGVNLFVPQDITYSEKEIEQAATFLEPIQKQLGASNDGEKSFPSYEDRIDIFNEQVEYIIAEKVPICSFTFGLPSPDVVSRLKQEAIVVIGTATTVKEAIAVEQAGMDIVVVQGSEAGGHRGNFISNDKDSLVGLMSLVPQVVDHVHIPVIAAGGIMDGRGLMAALSLGAVAVQMGTAFLTCEESGAHPVHKQQLLEAEEDAITLTRAFSGKWARGIKNEFIMNADELEADLPEFPVQNTLTKGLRKAAGEQGDARYMSLWSGQSPRLAKAETAAELLERVIKEAKALKERL